GPARTAPRGTKEPDSQNPLKAASSIVGNASNNTPPAAISHRGSEYERHHKPVRRDSRGSAGGTGSNAPRHAVPSCRADRLAGPRPARGVLVRPGSTRVGPASDGGGPAEIRGERADRPEARRVRQHPGPPAPSGRVDRSEWADDLAGDPLRIGLTVGSTTM